VSLSKTLDEAASDAARIGASGTGIDPVYVSLAPVMVAALALWFLRP